MFASGANTSSVQVGLTGGIGVGKSTVARLFALQRVPVYESDTAAKYLMNTRQDLRHALIQLLGPKVYDANGQLNKAFMRQQVFAHASLRAKVESYVHPAVRADYEQWRKRQQTPYVVKVAALLFEQPQPTPLDLMVLICSPWQLRLKRIQARDPHLTEAQIKAIRDSQWSDSRKKKKADYILYNDEKNSLIEQVQALPFWHDLKELP